MEQLNEYFLTLGPGTQHQLKIDVRDTEVSVFNDEIEVVIPTEATIYGNKTVYKGQINSRSEKHGRGELWLERDGKKLILYVGGWKNNKFDGYGNLYREIKEKSKSKTVLIYTGDFKDGFRTGRGTSYSDNGNVTYDGEWLDDCYHGKGTETDYKGNSKGEQNYKQGFML
jgi:hypothetical protein